jgi:hypothetical protein
MTSKSGLASDQYVQVQSRLTAIRDELLDLGVSAAGLYRKDTIQHRDLMRMHEAVDRGRWALEGHQIRRIENGQQHVVAGEVRKRAARLKLITT